jgi:hypothetical protein
MLYYNINYYYNRFFILNNNLYIFINKLPNTSYIYNFELNNNILFMKIINKNNNNNENISLKIIYNKKEFNINLLFKNDSIKIGNINNFIYENDFELSCPCIYYNKNYYINNNRLLDPKYLNNNEYIDYHWILCGRQHPHYYFKYLLKKNDDLIMNLKIPNIKYNENKKNTLLFIDDRYDLSFKYLLKLFCYSIDETWNIKIFTVKENIEDFKKDLESIGVEGNIIILEKSFQNKDDYSILLKNKDFWKKIKEDNCLLFQYDSFCMGKFNPIFFNYNYIGAKWPHKATKYNNIFIGNGGTSFRKTRIMELMCENNNKRRNYAEDIYFAEVLYENNLLNCTIEIADMFAFENIFNDNSIYAHQIYNTISLNNMDTFINDKLIKMI